MDDLLEIQKVTGVEIPVKSGTPWKKHETKREKDKIKEKKLLNQMGHGEKEVKRLVRIARSSGATVVVESKRNPYKAARQGLVMGVANEGLIKREENLSHA
jgi:hypothetical protein